jgi:hypothetical protein
MPNTSFKQISSSRFFAPFFNILAFLAPVYFLIRFAIRVNPVESATSLSAWLATFFLAFLQGVVLLVSANYFCDIGADEAGVSVTFLWSNLHVDWQNIVEIKPMRFFGRTHSWVVLTKKLTPFHRLYGALYGFSWLPSFIISPSLRDGEKLAKIIEERIRSESPK